jgi:hypothetical protein
LVFSLCLSFFIIAVLGVCCDIYKSLYTISLFNSLPPSFSFISSPPHSWNSFNRSYFMTCFMTDLIMSPNLFLFFPCLVYIYIYIYVYIYICIYILYIHIYIIYIHEWHFIIKNKFYVHLFPVILLDISAKLIFSFQEL